jgi:hypothetical protein
MSVLSDKFLETELGTILYEQNNIHWNRSFVIISCFFRFLLNIVSFFFFKTDHLIRDFSPRFQNQGPFFFEHDTGWVPLFFERQCKAWTAIASSSTAVMGSNPTRGMDPARGGWLEYLHRSPVSKRRLKGNPVLGGIPGPPCAWGI